MASDGQETLARLTEGPHPRLILLALMMPRMNGRKFLQRPSADL
jgi:CheY-like chemotaxis protein